jgi:hypothetical protein
MDIKPLIVLKRDSFWGEIVGITDQNLVKSGVRVLDLVKLDARRASQSIVA